MTWDKGFNFRATSGYVTDGANETYVLSETYPVPRNGVTFGWDATGSLQVRDRNAGLDRRLAGCHFDTLQRTFRVDVLAAGNYSVRLALGDPTNPQTVSCTVKDGSTTLLTVGNTSVIAGSTVDATGTIYTDANWPASNTAVTVTMVGTALTVVVPPDSYVQHLFISQLTTATKLIYTQQPVGYTNEGVLVTQPIVQAVDNSNVVDTGFTGLVTLTPTVASSQFYTTNDLVKTTHTVQGGSTASAINVSPAITFPASQPGDYNGKRYAILFTSGALAGVSRYLASNTGTAQVSPISAFAGAPTLGDTCVIRSGTAFPTMALACVAGVATFSGLVLSGWRATAFVASSPGLTSATSDTLTPTGTFDSYNGVTMPAELPRVVVDSTEPTVTDPTAYTINPSNTDVAPHFKSFTSALAWFAANDSTLVRKTRVQGGNYTEFVTLPNRVPTANWLIFEWNTPTSGNNRAVPLLNMVGCPRITTLDDSRGVMWCDNYTGGSNVVHHIRFKNIDFNPQTPTDPATEIFNIASLWDGVGNTLAGMPHHLGFDGCMLRGTSQIELRRAFYLGCKEFYCVNGTIADVHETGSGDTQAFAVSGTCAGPLRIQNNSVQAAGEIILSGGGDTPVAGLVCSDVQILYNHIWKPLSWKRATPGVYVRGTSWNTKNLLELKSACRWQIEGNCFENEWEDAQDASFVIGSTNQTNTSEFQGVRHITIRYNLFRNSPQWIIVSGENNGSGGFGSAVIARNISIHNNLAVANNSVGTPFDKSPSTTPRQLVIGNDVSSVWLVHNTIVSTETGSAAFMEYDINVAVGADCAFNYNIMSFPYYGTTGGTGVGFYGDMFTNGFTAGALKCVILDLDAVHGSPFSGYDQTWGNSTFLGIGFRLPSILATVATATFDSVAAAFALVSGAGGSLYNAAHAFTGDGKDAGCNITALRVAIADVETGGTIGTTPVGTSRSRAARLDETGFGVFTDRNYRR